MDALSEPERERGMRGEDEWVDVWRRAGARGRMEVRRINQRGDPAADPDMAALAVGQIVRARERASVSSETQAKLFTVAGVGFVLAGLGVLVQALIQGLDVVSVVLAVGFVAIGLVYALYLARFSDRAERAEAVNREVIAAAERG